MLFVYLYHVYVSLVSSHFLIHLFVFLFWPCSMIDYSWCCNAFLLNPKVDARSYKRSVFCFTKKFFCIYLLFTSLLPLLYPELIYLIFLMQVGYVTTICFSCFLIRCVMVSPLFFKNLSDSCCMVLKLSLIILYCVRCALMHLIKPPTLMSWTIPFWILYITWWVCISSLLYFFFHTPHCCAVQVIIFIFWVMHLGLLGLYG